MKALFQFQRAVIMRALHLYGVLFAAAGRGVLLVAPTGAGKTVIASHLIRVLAQLGQRTLFIAERKELLDQAVAQFQEMGLEVGELRSGRQHNLDAPVVVASKHLLINRLQSRRPLPDVRLVLIDEAHRSFSDDWQALLLEGFPHAFRLGLTATPERLDGAPLSGLFDQMLHVDVSIEDLIARKRLAPVRYMTPVKPKEWEFSVWGNDFSARAITKGMRDMRHQIVAAWKTHAETRSRTAVFCVSREQADELAEEFRRLGIPAVSVHSLSTDAHREQALAAFERGDVKVLCSVDLFIEGLDLPEIDTVLLARPTMSLRIFLQSVGRGMRAKQDGGELLVLDCAGNVYRHGLPTWDRRHMWSLEGREVDTSSAARRGKYRDSFISCGTCGTLREKEVHECPCGNTRDAARKNGVLQKPRARATKAPTIGVDPAADRQIASELYGHAVRQGRPDAIDWVTSVMEQFGAKLSQQELAEVKPVKPSPATLAFLRRHRREIAKLN